MTTPWTEWEAQAKAKTIDELEFAIRDCRQAEQAMRGWNPEKEGWYSDQAATFSDELRKRIAA